MVQWTPRMADLICKSSVFCGSWGFSRPEARGPGFFHLCLAQRGLGRLEGLTPRALVGEQSCERCTYSTEWTKPPDAVGRTIGIKDNGLASKQIGLLGT